MEAILKALTDNLVAAIGLLLPALVGFALAWLKAKQAAVATEEAQKNAALAVVQKIEADDAHGQAVGQDKLDNFTKKARALAEVRARLPKGVAPKRMESVGRLVEDAVSEMNEQRRERIRSSMPPADPLEEDLSAASEEVTAPGGSRRPR